MKEIIDNFSSGAKDYAQYRPDAPATVFEFLYDMAPSFDKAWDCGTGNGQVAAQLANRFKEVYATDISTEQLKLAPALDNIKYRAERAEQTSLPDKSINLITVAQAIHWFDFDRFYAEVNRVAMPGAIIAAWTYTVLRLTPAINEVTQHLYEDITRRHWNIERNYVDAAYNNIPFPFEEIDTPVFHITRQFEFHQLVGYLRTWSGVQRYMNSEQKDPVLLVMKELETAWGANRYQEAIWPVYMRAGRVG